jgi:serine/threonine protein phosphatase PrpC
VSSCAARGGDQDRATVIAVRNGLVAVLADGAGGTGGGARAAQAVIDRASTQGDVDAPWAELLLELDDDLQRGGAQTTAVIAAIGEAGTHGVSVGDSEAWLIGPAGVVELTRQQHRKPLVGGGCSPVAFRGPVLAAATLLLGSDGLFRYASAADIARIARGEDLELAARDLIALVRLPSGDVPDDVTVVLVRG